MYSMIWTSHACVTPVLTSGSKTPISAWRSLHTQPRFDLRMWQSEGGPLSLTRTNKLLNCASLPKHLPQTYSTTIISFVVLLSFEAETLTLKSSYSLSKFIFYSINFMEFVFLSNPKIWTKKGLSVPKLVIKIRNAFISCALDLKENLFRHSFGYFVSFWSFVFLGCLNDPKAMQGEGAEYHRGKKLQTL